MAIINTITADNTELSAENLSQTVTLSISAQDTNDAAALFTHNWVILDKPPTSTAVLSADTGTSVTFDADIWGTYRIFCISQNTITLETSNQDPLRAPLTDFIEIEVRSENYDLYKPAKSQRNWHSRYWHLVDVVEGLKGGDPATFIAGGTSEIATAAEIAQSAGVSDSTSGLHHLVVTTEQLNFALTPTANGQLTSTQNNNFRDSLKSIALEQINESSITELKDVDTTTNTPSDGDFLVWDADHVDDTNGDTGAWVPTTLSLNSGDITGVIAGDYLTGGGLSGDVTLNVADIDVNAFAANSIQLSSEAFSDNDTSLMTSAAILDLIQANAGSGSSSVGDARDIQLADGSGGFIAANWQVSTGDDLIPVTTNAYDLGSSTKRVRKTYATDGQYYGNVSISGNVTVVGQAIFQDYATINDNGAAGSLLLTAGENGVVTGTIRNKTDNVVIESVASGGEASLEFKAGSGAVATQKLLSNSGKLSNNNSIKLPAMTSAPSVGDFLRTSVVSGRDVEVEFEAVNERVVYSTHVSREVTEEATFSAGNMVFSGNQQACMYWFKNNTGQTLTLKSTHIHVGEMKNVSLSFSLCKATSDSNAINNSWTQVGSVFTLTNSSGTDNVIGQAQSTTFTNTTITAGQYLGICCTDIPVLNRDDRRIIITFECEKALT